MKKMKFSVLSGAYVNAGDFLIVKRTIDLLKHIYPNCEIKEYKRDKDLEEYLEEINKTDALILAGGPAYIKDLYPNIIPLVKDLDKVKTKIVTIGLGWYGSKTDINYIKNYLFTNETIKLLKRIVKDSKNLACRDWYSVKALTFNNLTDTLMTGCPAWYNINKINELYLRNGGGEHYSIKKYVFLIQQENIMFIKH